MSDYERGDGARLALSMCVRSLEFSRAEEKRATEEVLRTRQWIMANVPGAPLSEHDGGDWHAFLAGQEGKP